VDTLRGYSAATYSAPGGDFLANHTSSAINNGGALPGTLAAAGVSSLVGARSTNAVAYRSPSFGGVVITGGLTAESQTITNNAGVITERAKGSGNSLAATYNAGPLSVHGVIANAKVTGVTNTRKSSVNGVAVSYDIGMAKPYFVLENGKNTPVTSASATNDKYSAWELGSTFPMGAFTPYVTIGQGKVKNNVTGSTVVGTTKTRAFQVGTTYALSKRTYVYGAVGQDKFTETTAGVPAAQIDSMKRSGYKLGLVHQF
jgi:predicted porin